MSFIEEARAVEVFGRITRKWTKIKMWNILPGDTLWTTLARVSQFCLDHEFDLTLFIESRYDKYFFWARGKMKVTTLPHKLLLSPKPEEVYKEYEQKVYRMWKSSTKQFVEDEHFILRAIIQDALWTKKKLSMTKEQLPTYINWFHTYALAVDPDYLDLVLSSQIEPTQQVLAVWRDEELTRTLQKLRQEVIKNV